MSTTGPAVRVSVIMANYNGAAHIAAAVRSVLRQTERSLELIISDDGSTDDSLARAAAEAAGDAQLIILRAERNAGPAAARNRAVAAARGTWIAIVDNDDFIHPERLERLISAAEADGADIVADDLLTFYENVDKQPHAHLRGAFAREPQWITPAAYARSNVLFGGGAGLGYLKPLFRRTLPLRYDETLTIAEDSDLVLRLLVGGARMRVYPDLGYFYRKHAGSISHRLSLPALDAMLAAAERFDTGNDPALAQALRQHVSAIRDAQAFTKLIAALKARNFGAAVGAMLARPGSAALLREPILARLMPAKPKQARTGPRRVALLSRQRIVGATNGSSAYVLAIAGALKHAGFAVDYIGASPKIFGRWAAMKLRGDIDAFAHYHVHGGVRIGKFVFAASPAAWLASAGAVAARVLGKLGLPTPWSKPAEYAQAAAATRADQLYVAKHAAGTSAVLCDYCFLAPLAPYALTPDAPTLTIMHDLMSARVNDPRAEQTAAAVAALTSETEFRLLGMTDAVIAIQAEEAAKVRAALLGSDVIVAQHATPTVSAPQPGADDTLLFVGSNTPPNVVALEWFFRDIWPAIRAARPNAQLSVAGSASRGLSGAPDGVSLLGVVGDLAPLYRDAGVAISPLYTGSGLKIKLIEALAAGKAVVGTSVTVQGVEDIVDGVIARADEPAAFAEAVISLLAQPERRLAMGRAALDCAETHFSAAASFHELVTYVRKNAGASSQVQDAETILTPRTVQSNV